MLPELTIAVLLVLQAADGPRVSVDSTFPGYDPVVLTDGRWIAPGEETAHDYGDPNRLGNAGNTWVSSERPGVEHWVRLDWAKARELGRVEVWWSLAEWLPRAFAVELLVDGEWMRPLGPDWLAATERRTVLRFPTVRATAVRVVQHAHGAGARSLMALQEVLTGDDALSAAEVTGCRLVPPRELARLDPRALERNIARLFLEQPGAAEPVAWDAAGRRTPLPTLADGDTGRPVELPPGTTAVGVQTPIQHMLDGIVVHLAEPRADGRPTPEYHDGRAWRPIEHGLATEVSEDGRSLKWSFRPLATKAIRVSLPTGMVGVTEIEVSRYLPASQTEWLPHLTGPDGIEREMLGSWREPSFEDVASCALSMTPARALLGLKDSQVEVGVTWDGTLLGPDKIAFRFGTERVALADVRDTVTRTLIDGWRPGTVVEGRIGDSRIRETAFVAPGAGGGGAPALAVRVEITNLGDAPAATEIAAEVSRDGQPLPTPKGNALERDGTLALVCSHPAAPGTEPGRFVARIQVGPGETAAVDFAAPAGEPLSAATLGAAVPDLYDDALVRFRAYWDKLLAGAARVELPEERLTRCWRAVLCQILINGDGDIMPYGAAPSCYDGALFGLEEGYAMIALAYAGLLDDARRYMDATYLTDEFLAKVPEYRSYQDRHQQYRNGLEPYYAISLYRLCRDRKWIVGHRDLLRACADWTIRERRRTMVEENGVRPLHWGLLPKWVYGGDIADIECYALYANYACSRGLSDTAWLFGDLGDEEVARRYREEADAYRVVLDDVAGRNLRADRELPFWPLQLYAPEVAEGEGDYYQLFAGALLDLTPFDPEGPRLRYVTDFLERDNRMLCGLPRFRRDVGSGGIDGLYGMGYVLAKLRADRIDQFLLGLYGYLALNMERETFACRETNAIYASDLHVRSAYPVPDASDPVPCAAAVALHYLRHMLVTEIPARPGTQPDGLRLLAGAPRAWFANGKRVRFSGLPTEFGTVSVEVRSAADQGAILATVEAPTRNEWRVLELRLRHPEGKPIQRVTVNGSPYADVDTARELIRLRPGHATYEVRVDY